MKQGSINGYVMGFGTSLYFTVCAYFLGVQPIFGKGATELLIAAISTVQAIVFLFFYLNLGRESKPHWYSTVFLFTILVTVLVVVGSLWIMYHLNYNLMPRS